MKTSFLKHALNDCVSMLINSHDRLTRLKELDTKIRKCTECPHREQFPNELPTFQYASYNAILFVGRDPARNGWRQSGKAFYKPDGTLLSSGTIFKRQLEYIGMQLDEINFIELIKCFPIQHRFRPPTTQEVKNCSEWLTRQIDIIQPKIIVPLGKECAEYFHQKKIHSFSQFINEQHQIPSFHGIDVIPLFHPSGANNRFNHLNTKILRRIAS